MKMKKHPTRQSTGHGTGALQARVIHWPRAKVKQAKRRAKALAIRRGQGRDRNKVAFERLRSKTRWQAAVRDLRASEHLLGVARSAGRGVEAVRRAGRWLSRAWAATRVWLKNHKMWVPYWLPKRQARGSHEPLAAPASAGRTWGGAVLHQGERERARRRRQISRGILRGVAPGGA